MFGSKRSDAALLATTAGSLPIGPDLAPAAARLLPRAVCRRTAPV